MKHGVLPGGQHLTIIYKYSKRIRTTEIKCRVSCVLFVISQTTNEGVTTKLH